MFGFLICYTVVNSINIQECRAKTAYFLCLRFFFTNLIVYGINFRLLLEFWFRKHNFVSKFFFIAWYRINYLIDNKHLLISPIVFIFHLFFSWRIYSTLFILYFSSYFWRCAVNIFEVHASCEYVWKENILRVIKLVR